MSEFISRHFSFFTAVISLAMTGILALMGKTYAKREDVEELRRKFNSLETKINALPTIEQFHRVEIGLSDLSGDVKEIKQSISSVNNIAQMLLEKQLSEKD